MDFEWDEDKAKANLQKHEISFNEATTVFEDIEALLIYDPDHSNTEDRFILLGISQLSKILVVCHCYRESETKIRIISARKATKNEKNSYQRSKKNA